MSLSHLPIKAVVQALLVSKKQYEPQNEISALLPTDRSFRGRYAFPFLHFPPKRRFSGFRKAAIDPVLLHRFTVLPRLNDMTLLNRKNPIGRTNRFETVDDHHKGFSFVSALMAVTRSFSLSGSTFAVVSSRIMMGESFIITRAIAMRRYVTVGGIADLEITCHHHFLDFGISPPP